MLTYRTHERRFRQAGAPKLSYQCAGATAHTHDQQVVACLLCMREDGLVGRHIGAYCCLHFDAIALSHLRYFADDGAGLLMAVEATPPAACSGVGHVESSHGAFARAREPRRGSPGSGDADAAAWNHSWNRPMGVIKVWREDSESRNRHG